MMSNSVTLLPLETMKLLERFDVAIAELFPLHPFRGSIDSANFEAIMTDYVAMSIAFPYIQAGAAYAAYKQAIEIAGVPDANARITAAIGAFLTWDEFGGHELILEDGSAGLLRLTEVDRNFHSALLLADVEKVLGRRLVQARPSPITQTYLDRLYAGLSCASKQKNVAYMVAFERHAMAMISALWTGIDASFEIADSDQLGYFKAHLGNNSTGEAVHIAMTEKMIAELVPVDQADRFLDLCIEAYALNVAWCDDIIDSANRDARAALVA